MSNFYSFKPESVKPVGGRDWVSLLVYLFSNDFTVTHVSQNYTPNELEGLLRSLITGETPLVPQSYRYFLEEARKLSIHYHTVLPPITMSEWNPFPE